MTEEQIKQAYVTGLAARGLLRMHKMADAPAPRNPGEWNNGPITEEEKKRYYSKKDDGSWDRNWFGFGAGAPKNAPETYGERNWRVAGEYAKSTAGGAGIGAIVGALINLARQKSLVSGALIGAGAGAGLGAGYRGLQHIPGFAEHDPLKGLFSKKDKAKEEDK